MKGGKLGRDTGMADRLRADGLMVKEIDGWKTRGADTLNPKCFIRHHTAGPATGTVPSLQLCIHGRADLAGPLCNLYLGRDRVVYVIAAGKANHAGLPDGGSWKGCHGNSDAYGIEIEHTGTKMLDAAMHDVSARACAAIIRGRFGSSMVCDHKEWAPSRKIDLATGPSASAFRALVDTYLKGSGGGGDFLMSLNDAQQDELFENSRLSKQFAEGVQTFYEAYKNNGNSMNGLEMPASVDKPNEIAGWKLAKDVKLAQLNTQ